MLNPTPSEAEGRLIPLTRGLFAVVDECDFQRLSAFKWRALKCRKTFYAARTISRQDGDECILMHRVILGTAEGVQVDHIDLDGLNNIRKNLREASKRENSYNRRKSGHAHYTSRFKGVSRSGSAYRATIKKDGITHSLGAFASEEDAADAYDSAAKVFFGAFAKLNFQEGK